MPSPTSFWAKDEALAAFVTTNWLLAGSANKLQNRVMMRMLIFIIKG
jgi:hypothetical protein